MVTLAALSEPELELPPLDAEAPFDLGSPLMDWHDRGLMVFRGLIPPEPIDAYCARFEAQVAKRATGFGIGTPYLQVRELRDVAMHRALTPWLDALHGEPMGLHLNLTGWESTQRAWHTDRYLNPPCVGDWYAGVWVALGDIAPDAGPFEFVPGSHRWPRITRARMLAELGEDGSDPDWPWHSERLLAELFDSEIAARGASVEQFIAAKGDVLIWHSNLVHRGSAPTTPGKERRTLISHWSCVSRRCDMPQVARYESAHAEGLMFALGPIAW